MRVAAAAAAAAVVKIKGGIKMKVEAETVPVRRWQ